MKLKIWAALIAVYIVWGSTYLGIRFTVATIPPFLQAALRFLVSGTLLFIWRRMAGDPAPTRGQWRSAVVIGGLLLVGGNGLISLAETNIPSGVAALLVATIPMFMVLVEALRPGGIKPTFWQVIGLLIGFSGVVILIGPAEFGGVREFSLLGGATALFAAILWSLGSIYSRSAELPKSTLLLTGMEMLAGSLGLFIVSGLTGEFSAFQIANVSRSSLLGLLYLICFGSLVGFTSYAWLLRNAPISLISTYPYVNPIVAILLGWLFGDGIPGARIFIAALVILGSVVVVSLAGRHTAQPEHMEPDEIV